MSSPVERRLGWYLDKKIPLALFLAIAVQTGTAIWWAAGITKNVESQISANQATAARIAALEAARNAVENKQSEIVANLTSQTKYNDAMTSKVAALEAGLLAATAKQGEMIAQLARLDERTLSQTETLRRIEAAVEKGRK